MDEQIVPAETRPWWKWTHLPDERKAFVAEKIVSLSQLDVLYRLQLCLSCIIATLGLLIDSAPVVIGAMLIAPILQPIQSFAFAIATGNKSLYVRSLNNLFFTVLVSALISGLVAYVVPFAKLTPEILSRTSPTFIDLMIAVASGIIAMMALGYKRLSDTLAGVAMAAALIPPLAVVGVGLSMLRWDIAQGSMLLFLANLIALILVGLIIFSLFGFVARDPQSKILRWKRIVLVLITVALISYPLWTSMQTITAQYALQSTIKQTSTKYFTSINSAIVVDSISVRDNLGVVTVDLAVQAPDTVRITNSIINNLSRKLTQNLGQSVLVDVSISKISGVVNDPVVVPTPAEEIMVRDHLAILFPDVKIQDLSVTSSGDLLVVSIDMLSPDRSEMFHKTLFYWQKVLAKYLGRPVKMFVNVEYVDSYIFE